MNLYIYTKAPRLNQAVATNLPDLAALVAANGNPIDPDNATTLARISATIPELTLGDNVSFTVYAYDDGATLSSWSGAASNTVTVGIGLLDLTGDQLLASANLTAAGSGFTGRLNLNASELVSRTRAAITGGFGQGKWFESNKSGAAFPIQFRHVDNAGNYETIAMWNVFVRDRVIPT